jgi:hypothetical protein
MTMTRRRIADVFAKALAPRATAQQNHEQPHFHQGAQGNPAACFEPGCRRPQLEV